VQTWCSLQDGKSVTRDLRRKGAAGNEVWFSATLSPFRGLDGEIAKVTMIAQDVTENMLLRLDADGKLRAIDRAQAVIEFDMSGKVLAANSNFLKLMNYQLDEVKGHHHRLFVEPEHAATSDYTAFWERLARGEYDAGEYKRIGKGGKEVWIQATYNPIFDARGSSRNYFRFRIRFVVNRLPTSPRPSSPSRTASRRRR